MSVGLVKVLEESFGMIRGLAITYAIGCIITVLFLGFPRLGRYSRKFLFIGLPFAVACSLCFTTSLQISEGGRQTIEVGMVNYLWPSLTIICAILFNRQHSRWYVVIGFLVTICGLGLVLSGGHGFHPLEIVGHVRENPASYGLAAMGALAWALYSSACRAWGRGQNPTPIIFGIDAVIFSGLLLTGAVQIETPRFTLLGLCSCVAAGIVFGGAYAVWTYGIQKGSMTVMAIASYFTPVLSCIFAVFWINADLQGDFWTGVALVVAGSLVCWDATGRGMKALEKKQCVK